MPDGETTTTLTVAAATVDETYTCSVTSGVVVYSADASVQINGKTYFVRKCHYFSQLDLHSAFSIVRTNCGSEPKIKLLPHILYINNCIEGFTIFTLIFTTQIPIYLYNSNMDVQPR